MEKGKISQRNKYKFKRESTSPTLYSTSNCLLKEIFDRCLFYKKVPWRKEYLEAPEQRYEKKIGEILGIVTPFTAQKKAVQKALAGVLGRDAGIVVGTVHALQGAERDVVLFSPVYGQGHSGNTFFDAGPNMMNVAVSRARDSFIVIGNPDLFSEGSGKPSGILARQLRKKKSA